MRSRCRLHINKLHDFAKWLRDKGWIQLPTKSEFEALRMMNPSIEKRINGILLVHRKDSATEHLTTWGVSDIELTKWLKWRKKNDEKNNV